MCTVSNASIAAPNNTTAHTHSTSLRVLATRNTRQAAAIAALKKSSITHGEHPSNKNTHMTNTYKNAFVAKSARRLTRFHGSAWTVNTTAANANAEWSSLRLTDLENGPKRIMIRMSVSARTADRCQVPTTDGRTVSARFAMPPNNDRAVRQASRGVWRSLRPLSRRHFWHCEKPDAV